MRAILAQMVIDAGDVVAAIVHRNRDELVCALAAQWRRLAGADQLRRLPAEPAQLVTVDTAGVAMHAVLGRLVLAHSVENDDLCTACRPVPVFELRVRREGLAKPRKLGLDV